MKSLLVASLTLLINSAAFAAYMPIPEKCWAKIIVKYEVDGEEKIITKTEEAEVSREVVNKEWRGFGRVQKYLRSAHSKIEFFINLEWAQNQARKQKLSGERLKKFYDKYLKKIVFTYENREYFYEGVKALLNFTTPEKHVVFVRKHHGNGERAGVTLSSFRSVHDETLERIGVDTYDKYDDTRDDEIDNKLVRSNFGVENFEFVCE